MPLCTELPPLSRRARVTYIPHPSLVDASLPHSPAPPPHNIHARARATRGLHCIHTHTNACTDNADTHSLIISSFLLSLLPSSIHADCILKPDWNAQFSNSDVLKQQSQHSVCFRNFLLSFQSAHSDSG